MYFDVSDLLIDPFTLSSVTMNSFKPEDIDAYIADFPGDVQTIMRQFRKTIMKAAPEATESISYGIAAFSLYGRPLVYFAGFKRHIGFYATPTGHEQFKEDFAPYKTGKGSVQFPLDKPMPYDLVTKVVKFRAKENAERALIKKH